MTSVEGYISLFAHKGKLILYETFFDFRVLELQSVKQLSTYTFILTLKDGEEIKITTNNKAVLGCIL